mgnify:CR=1 FL=1
MKLVYKDTKEEVKKGDILTDFRGEKAYAYYWREPNHGIGKISTKTNLDDIHCRESYVSVYGLEWIEDWNWLSM